jgi:hypothetical protein
MGGLRGMALGPVLKSDLISSHPEGRVSKFHKGIFAMVETPRS